MAQPQTSTGGAGAPQNWLPWAAALRAWSTMAQGDCCPSPALEISVECCLANSQQKRGVPVGVPRIPKVPRPTGSLWSAVPCSVLHHTKHWPAEQATRPVLTVMPPQLLRLTFWVDQMHLSLCDYSKSKGRVEKGWVRVQEGEVWLLEGEKCLWNAQALLTTPRLPLRSKSVVSHFTLDISNPNKELKE